MLIFKLKLKFKNLQNKNLDNPKEIKIRKIMEKEIEKATTLIKRFIKKTQIL